MSSRSGPRNLWTSRSLNTCTDRTLFLLISGNVLSHRGIVGSVGSSLGKARQGAGLKANFLLSTMGQTVIGLMQWWYGVAEVTLCNVGERPTNLIPGGATPEARYWAISLNLLFLKFVIAKHLLFLWRKYQLPVFEFISFIFCIFVQSRLTSSKVSWTSPARTTKRTL